MIKFKPHEEDKHGVTIKKEQREKNHTYQEGQVPSHLISSKRKKRVQNWSIFCANPKHMVQYTSHFVKFPYSKVVHLHLNPESCIIHYFTGS